MTQRLRRTLLTSTLATLQLTVWGSLSAEEPNAPLAPLRIGEWRVAADSVRENQSAQRFTGNVRVASASTYVVAKEATLRGRTLRLTHGTVFTDDGQLSATNIDIDVDVDRVVFVPHATGKDARETRAARE